MIRTIRVDYSVGLHTETMGIWRSRCSRPDNRISVLSSARSKRALQAFKGLLMDGVYEIAIATKGDIDTILDLQESNLPERGGTLSARLSRVWFETAIAAQHVIVARRAGRVVGYLVTSPLAAYAEVPVVQAMLEAYRGASDAYVYGPICVAELERGRGIAKRMFSALRSRLPGREGVLFIRSDNAASLQAHARMGMHEVAGFDHNRSEFIVLSYTS